MSGLVQKREDEVFVHADLDKTFKACLFSAEQIGKVKQSSKTLGHISISIPMSLFPPRNPTNIKVSVKPASNGCIVTCVGESVDGLVGFGSVHKSIDRFFETLTSYLDI